ncbi:hypothetical protein VroAM7_31530 [Vibrio rotiferianus]|uniref:GrpB family protein n=1 Tax=Vibrio rotiferianus TaxID=190895 RepID=A0A510IE42_9VIBR|nr:GrpB family protein [Vibrio rotiferianus]BBL90500.1 hypothetical protein VroAM7_31530 [Vibrio rotiferianus]
MNKAELIEQLEELNVGLKRFTVDLVRQSDSWTKAFELINSVIAAHLNGATVHHIGSTAIPGALAKPIIDIGIAYDSDSTFEQEKHALKALGFTSKGEHGVKGRLFFTFYNHDESFDYIHIHAYKRGDKNLSKHIGFRDAHIHDAELVVEYNTLKHDLVEGGVCRQDYPRAKTAYIEKVLSLTLTN